MFNITQIDLGTIKVGSIHTLEYPYTEDVNYIERVTSPCDCASVKNDIRNRKIIISYKAKPISKHLELQGITQQEIEKTIKVEYKSIGDDNTRIQNLKFTALVKK